MFNKSSSKALKGDNIFCQVKENRIYLTNGFVVFIATPAEYENYFRSVTKRDAGNFKIDKAGCIPSDMDIASIVEKGKNDAVLLEKTNILIEAKDGRLLSTFRNGSVSIAANRDFISAFSEGKMNVKWYGSNANSPLYAFVPDSTGECVGIVLPVRITDNDAAAIQARPTSETKDADNVGSVSELEQTNAELSSALAEVEEELEATRAALRACRDRIAYLEKSLPDENNQAKTEDPEQTEEAQNLERELEREREARIKAEQERDTLELRIDYLRACLAKERSRTATVRELLSADLENAS